MGAASTRSIACRGAAHGGKAGVMSTIFPLPAPMLRALSLARAAAEAGEVPIGAVISRDGIIIAEGENRNRRDNDPTAHAEIVAIRAAASALGDFRLTGCDLWVTLEPCAMCAGAISHARIARLYYGAEDPKGGAVETGARIFTQPQCMHRPEVYSGIGEAESARLLRTFFADRR
jgi:tRNA(adenine34) deaminase